MPKPVYSKKPVEYVTDEPPVERHIPDSPGLWYCTLLGSTLPVKAKRGTGELVFPAGTYAEDETPVTYLERFKGGPAWEPYILIHPVIDI